MDEASKMQQKGKGMGEPGFFAARKMAKYEGFRLKVLLYLSARERERERKKRRRQKREEGQGTI